MIEFQQFKEIQSLIFSFLCRPHTVVFCHKNLHEQVQGTIYMHELIVSFFLKLFKWNFINF
jgi:hypothetical protein